MARPSAIGRAAYCGVIGARSRARFNGSARRSISSFFLLQQNEASDWADIMPRSGFVLYTNALWYRVKRFFDLPNAAATRENFNGLFHPFSAELARVPARAAC